MQSRKVGKNSNHHNMVQACHTGLSSRCEFDSVKYKSIQVT